MISSFEGQTADEVWVKASEAVLRSDIQEGRGGRVRELSHVGLQIQNPRARWVVSRREPLNVAFALAEVIWILDGSNRSAFPVYFNRALPKFAGKGPVFHGAYGERLRSRFGLDQLRRASAALRANPISRQVALQIWSAKDDLPRPDGQPIAEDIPCNVVAMLKVRDQKLFWTQIMRSNDAYLGLPHNIVQFTALQEIIAGWIGVEPGSYSHWSDSLHFYENDVHPSPILTTAPRIPDALDSLSLSEVEFDSAWPNIVRIAYAVADEAVAGAKLKNMLLDCAVPSGWQDVLGVLVAEGLRRRKDEIALESVCSSIRSSMLQWLFEQWLKRFSKE